MDLKTALRELEALASDEMISRNAKRGAKDNQYGVKLGDIRALAKRIKKDHDLALELWATGNIDARLLAILLMKPGSLSTEDLDRLAHDLDFHQVADWFNAYLVKKHRHRESLREKWMDSDHSWVARSGWSLCWDRVTKDPEGLDLGALLDRIEAEAPSAASETQWTMNFTLAEAGIHFPEHRDRVLALGEKLGMFRDYPVSKGCVSPFAPIWVTEMVSRQSG